MLLGEALQRQGPPLQRRHHPHPDHPGDQTDRTGVKDEGAKAFKVDIALDCFAIFVDVGPSDGTDEGTKDNNHRHETNHWCVPYWPMFVGHMDHGDC